MVSMESFPPVPPYFSFFNDNSSFIPPDPPKPIEGEYEMFGARYTTKTEELSLEQTGLRQLCDEDGSNSASDLKRLSKMALLHFSDLIRGMVQGENQDERIAALETIFVNMHFIANRHRPQQAIDSVCAMLRQEIERQKRLAEEIDAACEEAEKVLEATNVGPSKKQKTEK